MKRVRIIEVLFIPSVGIDVVFMRKIDGLHAPMTSIPTVMVFISIYSADVVFLEEIAIALSCTGTGTGEKRQVLVRY